MIDQGLIEGVRSRRVLVDLTWKEIGSETQTILGSVGQCMIVGVLRANMRLHTD